MNKYLFKKIEQAHSAYFENLIFLSSEVFRNEKRKPFGPKQKITSTKQI